MGPFSGSDQVSAVVKLSLFGRKNSKHEPVKAAHPSACILSDSCQERAVFYLSFCGFFRFHSCSEILIKALSARRISHAIFPSNGTPHVFKVFCVNSSTSTLSSHGATFSLSLSFAVCMALNTF